jgi:hypothetical protein
MRLASPWKHPDTGIYYFRRGVPEALRPLVGKREDKVSLETRDWRDELLMDGLSHSAKARPVDRFLARQLHRPAVDAILAERGIDVDAAGMATLMRLATEAVEQVDERLLRAAQGDYSPDPREARFPPLGAPQARQVSACVPFDSAWEAYLAERKPAAGTAKSYRGAMRNLLAFVGTDDIARVTEEDVRR